MSRVSEERTKRFKKDDFALQLMVAIGSRSPSTFCKDAGLDYKTFKDYMNERRDTAPGFKFIKRVASISCDESVNLETLALASGFTQLPKEDKSIKTPVIVRDSIQQAKDVAREKKIYKPVDTETKTERKDSVDLSTFIRLAESYDEYSQVKYYIFDNKETFKKFGKLVRLYGLNKAMETAEKDERPIFELDRDTILKFISDKPIAGFSALNGNKVAIVF